MGGSGRTMAAIDEINVLQCATHRRAGGPAPWAQIGASLALCFAVAWFIHRAFLPSGTLWDFAVSCSASHAWLTGQNPYDPQQVTGWWLQHAGGLRMTDDIRGLPVVNAPTSLVVTAPFALFRPGIAAVLWVGATLILLLWQIAALLKMSGLKPTEPRGLILAASVLVSVPVILGVLAGQSTVIAIPLLVLGARAAMEGRHPTAGILLGLSAAMKFQIALPLIFLYFILGQPRVGFWGLATFFTALVIALVGLQLGGTPWFNSWLSSLHEVGRPGGMNDFAADNPYRISLLNLQMVFGSFLTNRMLINALSAASAGLLAILLLGYIRRNQRNRDELLILAIAAAICLLPVYHRLYDALLLTLVAAWTLKHWNAAEPLIPRVVAAILVTCFVLPPVSFGNQTLLHGLIHLQAFRAFALLGIAILLVSKALSQPTMGWKRFADGGPNFKRKVFSGSARDKRSRNPSPALRH
jgi:Glycosyltransferase family 87